MIETFLNLLSKELLIKTPWPKQAFALPQFQAHRGVCIEGDQENTMEAFKKAKQYYAKMIECDVQLSKDRVPIIFHDKTTERFSKTIKLISELTANELGQLVNAPTLEQLLLSSDVPEFINIEIKSNSIVGTPLERKIVELIFRLKADKRVLFSSFNPFSLYLLSHLAPQIPRALLVSNDNHKDNRFYLKKMLLAPLTGFHMLNLDYKMIDPEILKLCQNKGIPISAWTVNEIDNVKSLINNGITSIISDKFFNQEMIN